LWKVHEHEPVISRNGGKEDKAKSGNKSRLINIEFQRKKCFHQSEEEMFSFLNPIDAF
jgi:hypothetical protein